MLQSILTLDCPTPAGQPLPREKKCWTEERLVNHTARKLGLPSAVVRSALETAKKHTASAANRRPDGLKIGSKDAIMVDMVLRPRGASRAEMREALGWRSDPYPSMMAACDKAGVEVTVIPGRMGQFRYQGSYQ